MPLTKTEAVQLKAAIWKCEGHNLVGTGPVLSKAHALELIDAYTEEVIREIEDGTRVHEFLIGNPSPNRRPIRDAQTGSSTAPEE